MVKYTTDDCDGEEVSDKEQEGGNGGVKGELEDARIASFLSRTDGLIS
jgi:hypothetical protein